MKFIIIFAAIISVGLTRPADEQIIRSESDVEPEGFRFAVETSDGSVHNAEGQLKNIGTDHEAITVHGSYSFVADDDQTYTVQYTADENGFQPQGAHLPVSPDVQ